MRDPLSNQQATELGDLLTGVVRGVIGAQDVLDAQARRQHELLVATPAGEIGLPPLWFTFKDVEVEIDLSATIDTVTVAKPRLVCRTVDPAQVSLYGYEATASLRLRARLGPQGFAQIVDEGESTPTDSPP